MPVADCRARNGCAGLPVSKLFRHMLRRRLGEMPPEAVTPDFQRCGAFSLSETKRKVSRWAQEAT